ncbi:hypothetical protein T265_13584, partial [Opisthorchis viverrini]
CEESVSSASKLYVPCVPSLVPETPAPLTHDLDHTADVQLHSWGDTLKEAFEQIAMAMFGYMTTNYDSVEMLEPYETEAKGEDSLSLLYHFLDEGLFAFSPYFIPRFFPPDVRLPHRFHPIIVIIIIDSMTSVFNTEAPLPYNHDLFESLVVKENTFNQAIWIKTDNKNATDIGWQPYLVICITEFDMENFRIKSVGWGEPFQLGKHPQVIDPHSLLAKPITFFQGTEVKAITYSNMQIHDKEDQHELFVIIDI